MTRTWTVRMLSAGGYEVLDEHGKLIAALTSYEDAHLVAAAPEMRAMLEEVREYELEDFKLGEWPRLPALIAKAGGA